MLESWKFRSGSLTFAERFILILAAIPWFARALNVKRARLDIEHLRDGKVIWRQRRWNLITNVGRVFMHTQCYSASPAANGLNFIALSNDTVTETASSTTLSNEITGNGLARAAGTVTLPTGSGNQTTVAHTFTATGTQACQKAALFTASSAGTMNHVLGFSQRTLLVGDTIAITFTITLG